MNGTQVGGVYYDVSMDTRKLIDGEREASRSMRRMGDEGDALATRLSATAAAVAVLAAAMSSIKIAQRADEFRLLAARVQVAAGAIEAGAVAFDELAAISRRTQTSLEGNAEVFNRLNQSILQMGGTQRDTLQMTELLAKAIKVSGASAVEAKAAMLQFGQAMGSGKLAGDELRSLAETAPYLMRQLADGIGVPVGALKKLGEDGKLTADVVANALTKAAAQIDADFKKVPQTIADAMTAASDAAALAMLKFDELTGGSAVMAGVVKGAGEVFDKLADQIGAANGKAGELGRNDAVRSWADTSRQALSYLIDAADLAWQTLSVLGRNVAFVFRSIGADIGGMAAQVVLMAKGDLGGANAVGAAMKADAEKRRAELDAADAKTLSRTKLFGQQMREAWEQGAGGGQGFVNPATAMSKLKAPAGDDKPKKATGAPFDGTGYLASLERATLDGYARIDSVEREALRKNDVLLEQKKLSLAEHMQAMNMIREEAAQQRKAQSERELEDLLARISEEGAIRDQEAKRQAAEEARKKQGRDFALGVQAESDPIARLLLEQERKKALLAQFAMEDQANMQLYADAKVALEQETERRITEIRLQEEERRRAAQVAQLQGYSAMFGGMADLAKAFGSEQSKTYKALFAVSKAFAIADSIIKIQQGIAGVLATEATLPKKIAGAALVASQGANLVATIRSSNFGGGRQYGGPVSSGTLYRVNETGRPEMFTGSNGSQYMLPTSRGRVTPADEVGGGAGGGWKIIINNAPPGTTATVDDQARTIEVAVAQAEARVADSLATNTGKVWSALRAGSNVQSRL
jgi:tape measure domain-containing protein